MHGDNGAAHQRDHRVGLVGFHREAKVHGLYCGLHGRDLAIWVATRCEGTEGVVEFSGEQQRSI